MFQTREQNTPIFSSTLHHRELKENINKEKTSTECYNKLQRKLLFPPQMFHFCFAVKDENLHQKKKLLKKN